MVAKQSLVPLPQPPPLFRHICLPYPQTAAHHRHRRHCAYVAKQCGHCQPRLSYGSEDDRSLCLECRVQSQAFCSSDESITRIRDPKTTALTFTTGKTVATGAKSEDNSRLASRNSRSRALLGVMTSSSPIAWRGLLTVTGSSAVMSLSCSLASSIV